MKSLILRKKDRKLRRKTDYSVYTVPMKTNTYEYTWENYCQMQLNDISIFALNFIPTIPKNEEPLEILEDIFSDLSHKINNNNYDIRVNNEFVYFQIAAYTMAMIDQFKLKAGIGDVYELLVRKQKDYGPLNITEFGSIGIVIRMFDKVARLRNLLTKNQNIQTANEVPNETFLDTLMDIIGYCTIGLMLEDFDSEYGCKFLVPMN